MKSKLIKDKILRNKNFKNEYKILILKFLLTNSKLNIKTRLKLINKQKKIKTFSNIKFVNRCTLTNRNRGNLRFFKLSRIKLRELLSLGLIPGYKKAVW